MVALNIFITEYEVIKENQAKYPLLHKNVISKDFEDSISDWLMLEVSDEVYDEFQILKRNISLDGMEIIASKKYVNPVLGISLFTESLVSILGEETLLTSDGEIIEQYIYNIEGVKTKNGKSFISIKSNIQLL